MKTLRLAVCSAAFASGLLARSAGAASYYAAPTGNDSNPGTLSAPWRTPHRALDTLRAGDKVYFRQGTYPITRFIYISSTRSSGTATAPILWASYPGETATIAFAGTSDPGEQVSFIFFVGRAYHHFERLRLTQTPESRTALSAIPRSLDAISAWAPGVQIRDCEIFDLTGQAVFGAAGARDMVIERNHLHGIQPASLTLAAPHGIYVNGQNQIIRDNKIHDLFYFCIKLAGDVTGQVYRNFCYNAGEGISCQNGPGTNMSVDIFNNIITHIQFHHPSAPGSGIDIYNGGRARVYNNVVAFSNYGAFVKNTPNMPVFRNNIFYQNNTQVITWRDQIDMDYNLYEPAAGNKFNSQIKGYLGDLAGWKSLYGEAHSISGDPKLAGNGLLEGDYKLLSGSAARDRATADGAPNQDYFGVTRPQGAAYDIGAHELVSGTVPSFDFSLSNGGNRSVTRGQSVTNAITASMVSGAAQPVGFSVSGLPSGVTASFSPASCTPNCSSTLTLSASTSAAAGIASVTVTASGGGASRTTAFTMTVNSPLPPSGLVTDLNGDGMTNVSDVQIAINQASGAAACSSGDVNKDGACNVSDIQLVVNKALGL